VSELPPNDIDAERAVLGALMLAAPLAEVRPLGSGDFYRPGHAIIFEAIEALAGDGKPIDALAVGDEIRRRRQLGKIQGAPYLHTCISSVPTAANAGYYARIVRQASVRRQVMALASRIGQAAADPAEDLADIAAIVGSDTSPETCQNLVGLLSSQYDSSDTNNDVRDGRLLSGVRDGAWLGAQEFPPLRFAIPPLIPEGFTLLIGAPKIGKSWLVLYLLLAAAAGGAALGQLPVGPARPVLYLALEDSDRRMQDRCQTLLGGQPIPAAFSYQTRVEAGQVLATVSAWMRHNGSTGLVVIDTLGRVMPPAGQGESAYQRDYRVGAALKAVADAHPGLAVLVNHHDRKASADDFIDSVSGTHGLAGAADTIAVLGRPRHSTEATLKVTGRDVPENEYALTLTGGVAWQLGGASLAEAAAEVGRRATARQLSGPMSAVLAFVQKHPEGVRAGEVAAQVEAAGANAYQYLKRLTEHGYIDNVERGLYVALSEVSEVAEPQVTQPALSDSDSRTVRNGDGWPEGSIGAASA